MISGDNRSKIRIQLRFCAITNKNLLYNLPNVIGKYFFDNNILIKLLKKNICFTYKRLHIITFEKFKFILQIFW